MKITEQLMRFHKATRPAAELLAYLLPLGGDKGEVDDNKQNFAYEERLFDRHGRSDLPGITAHLRGGRVRYPTATAKCAIFVSYEQFRTNSKGPRIETRPPGTEGVLEKLLYGGSLHSGFSYAAKAIVQRIRHRRRRIACRAAGGRHRIRFDQA